MVSKTKISSSKLDYFNIVFGEDGGRGQGMGSKNAVKKNRWCHKDRSMCGEFRSFRPRLKISGSQGLITCTVG